MRFCKEHGIRFAGYRLDAPSFLAMLLSGQKLGRPFQDAALQKAIKKQWREDKRIRNAIEGKFGKGKRRSVWIESWQSLKETEETVISLVFLVMNMERILRNEASSCRSAMMNWFLSVLERKNSELTCGVMLKA